MGFNTFQRMKATKSSPGGGGAFIGFDEKDIKKEFERAFKELENLHDGVTTAQIRRIARKALKPMVKAYRDEAKIQGPKRVQSLPKGRHLC